MSLILDGTNGLSDVDGTAGTPAIRGSDANTGVFFGTDIVGVSTGGSERMRVDASGNVGIGVTPETYSNGKALQINTSSLNDDASGSFHITQNGYFNSSWKYVQNGTAEKITYGAGVISFSNASNNTSGADAALAWSERMRIDTSGNLLVGTTSAYPLGSGLTMSATAYWANHATGVSSGTQYVGFDYAGASIGSITQNGTTAVAYNTTSDYRLKENVQPLSGALARVSSLKPCTYTWKSAPDEIGEGFIAHELAEVCPQAVTGEKDAVNEDGSIKPQSIDTSFLVATLTAAIQEQQAIINAQQAALESLTARVVALEQA